jgi:hypothetical protein
MKHIQTFESFINEGLIPPKDIFKVVDGEEGWSEDDDSMISVEYTFDTPTQKYRVKFSSFDYKAEDKTFEMSFGLDRGELRQIDVHTMTNEGNVRTIIKTIAFIIDEFLYQYDESAEKVIIEATDAKRKKLYQTLFPQYLSKDSLRKVTIK